MLGGSVPAAGGRDPFTGGEYGAPSPLIFLN